MLNDNWKPGVTLNSRVFLVLYYPAMHIYYYPIVVVEFKTYDFASERLTKNARFNSLQDYLQ